jgi:RecA-family ATPase
MFETNFDKKEEKPGNLKELLEESRLRIDDELIKPPALLEVLDGTHTFPILKRANITTIRGKGKAGKTTSMAMFTSAVIKQGKFMGKFYCPFENLKIALFDTEESKYDALTMMRIICKLRNIEKHPDNFDAFSLKRRKTKLRMQLIEDYIYSNNPDFVVIDGVRDLVRNINNPDEATDTVDELQRWNDEKNCHIFCVIHENKSIADKNSRGHIGTEIENRSESIFSTNRELENKYIFTITDELPRGRDMFEPISFTYKNNMPILTDYEHLQSRIRKDENEDTPF